jgi:Chromate transporter
VIIPLMQGDAVHTYHWMSDTQFLNAVALGQVTPGPIVATVAAVGYAAQRLAGGLLAAVVAFAPSFSFALLGGQRFERLRGTANARAFLDGAGPAAIGAILGAAVPLARPERKLAAGRPRRRRRRPACPAAARRRDAARRRRGWGSRGPCRRAAAVVIAGRAPAGIAGWFFRH